MALSFGKNSSKSRSSTNQSFNQNSMSGLTDRARGLLADRIGQIGGQEYRSLDPEAYKAYEDPYQQDVIDATTADIMAARAKAMNEDRAMLAGAGAFGDDRRGVVEANTSGEYDRTLATTLAGLRSGGFRFATGVAQDENTNRNAFDADLQRRLDALYALMADERQTRTSGTSQGVSKGRQSGFNLGFTYGGG